MRIATLALAAALGLVGCSATAPVNYSPQSFASLQGSVAAGPFTDSRGPGSANYIDAAIGVPDIDVMEPVSLLVQRAVALELRQSGLSPNDARCALGGEISEFSFNDWGLDATYKTVIGYRLTADGATLYQRQVSQETSGTKTSEFAMISSTMGRALGQNIGQVIQDPAFQQAVASNCR